MRVKIYERDLDHEREPVRFAYAMGCCEGYPPSCAEEGRCGLNGECFKSPPNLVAARMIESLLPKDGRAGMHFAYLRSVATMLRNERVYL